MPQETLCLVRRNPRTTGHNSVCKRWNRPKNMVGFGVYLHFCISSGLRCVLQGRIRIH